MIWWCKSSYWKCAIVTTTCHKGARTLLRQLASEHPVWKAFSKNPIQMDYVPVTCAVHAYCVFVLLIFRFNIRHLIPSSTNHNSEFPCIWCMQWIQYHCWKLNVPVACWHYPRQRTQQHLQKLSWCSVWQSPMASKKLWQTNNAKTTTLMRIKKPSYSW
jgi:hypothetical protein